MDAQAKPPLFGLHLHPRVDIISIQVIVLHLATGPHLHAVCEVAAAWGQDEVIDQHCQGTPDEWPHPENLGKKRESLGTAGCTIPSPLGDLTHSVLSQKQINQTPTF